MKNILLTMALFSFLTACTNQNSQDKSDQPDISLNAGVGVVTGTGDFGSLGPKDSKILSVRITNTGDQALQGPPSIDNNNFSIIYQSGCASIAPGKRCDLKISFNASGKAFQTFTGNLNLDSAFLALSATVVDPNPSQVYSVSFSPISPLNFGTITDKQSVIKTLVITNSGNTTLENQAVVLQTTNYSILSDGCSNKKIAPNRTCTLRISLNGVGKSGPINDLLSFGGPNIQLNGIVVSSSGSSELGSPNVQLLVENVVSTTADFGTLSGTQSKQIIVVAKNNGNKISDVSPAQLLANANFSIAFNQCHNRSLAPGASCQMRLVFSAAGKNGSYTDTLTYAGLSMTISASAQPLVTYTATYSNYGTCSALACQGSGIQSRTISVCNRLENGTITGTTDLSNCSQFATQAYLEQSCPSPSGQATLPVTGGTETISCAEGQTTGNIVSLNCSEPGYIAAADGQSCVVENNDNSDNITVFINKRGIFGTGEADYSDVVTSPAPISRQLVTSNNSQASAYKFSYPAGTSSIIINPSPAGSLAVDFYTGDCQGTSCTLDVADGLSKSVVITYKDTASQFKLLDLNKSHTTACLTASGADIGGQISDRETCSSDNKNVEWQEYDCSSFNEFDCNSNNGCFYNPGMGGGGFNNCFMYGGDEFMCNMDPSCSFNYGTFSCESQNSGGSCEGGYQALCYSYDLNSQLYNVTSSADCNSAALVGDFFYTKQNASTFNIGGLTPYLNNKILFNGFSSTLRAYDLSTESITFLGPSSLDNREIIFNDKYYYMTFTGVSWVVMYSDGIAPAQKVQAPGVSQVIGNEAVFGPSFTNLSVFKKTSNALYFSQTNHSNHGGRLFKIDTNNTLSLVHELPLNQRFSESTLGSVGTKDYLFTCANNSLVVTSGTGITVLSATCNPSSATMSVIDYDNNIISYKNGTGSSSSLFVSNGTNAGTYSVSPIGNVIENVLAYPAFNGIFFNLNVNSTHGLELYKSSFNGSSYSTASVLDLNPGSTGSGARILGMINNKLVVRAVSAGSSFIRNILAIDSSNNITPLTSFATEINDVEGDSAYVNYGFNERGVVIGSKLYFIYRGQIFETDGTSSGTIPVQGVPSVSSIYSIRKIGVDKILISINHPDTGTEHLLFDPSL